MPDNKEEKRSGAESPTTAKQLDFDDDDHEAHDSGAKPDTQKVGSTNPLPASVEDEDAPPTKPPRPTSPQQQAEHTLIEAFPSIDAKVVKAVLTASGGQVEPAFNALLGMSDPSFQSEEAPPPQPPRPTAAQRQLEQDEMYARQLAQHYQSAERDYREGYGQQRGQGAPQRRPTHEDPDDRERNFFDDDLPEIRESVRQGFLQTQSTVNSWIKNFKKRLDGDEDDPYNGPTRLDPAPRRADSNSEWPRSSHGGPPRRSGDYDADPRELGDDAFTALELRDEEAPPPKPARPAANPDLFKPTPAPPQSGPVDEVDAAERRAGGGGAKKWQPLTAVAAQPEPDDNDPFSVGDSDDEKEHSAKDTNAKDSKTRDVREADTARLKKAASKGEGEGEGATAASTEAGGGKKAGLEEKKRGSVGTLDKDAEELLAKK